jgi:hypothetical protein
MVDSSDEMFLAPGWEGEWDSKMACTNFFCQLGRQRLLLFESVLFVFCTQVVVGMTDCWCV